MPHLEFSKEPPNNEVNTKRLTLPCTCSEYKTISQCPRQFRQWLDKQVQETPELFPP